MNKQTIQRALNPSGAALAHSSQPSRHSRASYADPACGRGFPGSDTSGSPAKAFKKYDRADTGAIMGRVALILKIIVASLFRSNIKILSNEVRLMCVNCSESFPVIVYIQTKVHFEDGYGTVSGYFRRCCVKALSRIFPLAGVTTNPSIIPRVKNRWRLCFRNFMKRWAVGASVCPGNGYHC